MIEIEEDNEKDYKFFKAFILLVESIIIGICIIFFIAIEKVDASMVCIGYNGSTEVFNTNNNGQGNIPSYTGALTYIKCYDTSYNLEGNNKTFTYGMSINIEYQTANTWTPNINYNMNGGYIDNINSLSFHRSDKCYFNTYRQDNDTTVALLNGKNRRLYGSMTCNGVDGQSSYTPPAFIIEFTSSGSNSSRNYKGAFTGQIATIAFDESTNQEEVISEIGQQTADLVNQINSQTNAIISNANDNTQNIIENQNENTDRVTEAIENQNKKCETVTEFELGIDNKYLTSNGTEANSNSGNYAISKYIEIVSQIKVITAYNSSDYMCYYNENKQIISCINQNTLIVGEYLSIPNGAKYFRYTYLKNQNKPKFMYETCYNLIEKQNENLDNINDTLNDSSIDNPSGALNGMENYFGTNGVISDLLLLPVRMFQSIVNSIDGTCSPFTLGTLYNHSLTMPCINLSSRIGSALYGVIDVLISGFFILSIRKKFVDVFEHFTSLKTGGNELE